MPNTIHFNNAEVQGKTEAFLNDTSTAQYADQNAYYHIAKAIIDLNPETFANLKSKPEKNSVNALPSLHIAQLMVDRIYTLDDEDNAIAMVNPSLENINNALKEGKSVIFTSENGTPYSLSSVKSGKTNYFYCMNAAEAEQLRTERDQRLTSAGLEAPKALSFIDKICDFFSKLFRSRHTETYEANKAAETLSQQLDRQYRDINADVVKQVQDEAVAAIAQKNITDQNHYREQLEAMKKSAQALADEKAGLDAELASLDEKTEPAYVINIKREQITFRQAQIRQLQVSASGLIDKYETLFADPDDALKHSISQQQADYDTLKTVNDIKWNKRKEADTLRSLEAKDIAEREEAEKKALEERKKKIEGYKERRDQLLKDKAGFLVTKEQLSEKQTELEYETSEFVSDLNKDIEAEKAEMEMKKQMRDKELSDLQQELNPLRDPKAIQDRTARMDELKSIMNSPTDPWAEFNARKALWTSARMEKELAVKETLNNIKEQVAESENQIKSHQKSMKSYKKDSPEYHELGDKIKQLNQNITTTKNSMKEIEVTMKSEIAAEDNALKVEEKGLKNSDTFTKKQQQLLSNKINAETEYDKLADEQSKMESLTLKEQELIHRNKEENTKDLKVLTDNNTKRQTSLENFTSKMKLQTEQLGKEMDAIESALAKNQLLSLNYEKLIQDPESTISLQNVTKLETSYKELTSEKIHQKVSTK